MLSSSLHFTRVVAAQYSTKSFLIHCSPKSNTSTMVFGPKSLTYFLLASKSAAWTSQHVARRSMLAIQLHSTVSADISTKVEGEEATESFRLQFQEASKAISPWHDIPLMNDDGSYNMVCRSRSPSGPALCQRRFMASYLRSPVVILLDSTPSWSLV